MEHSASHPPDTVTAAARVTTQTKMTTHRKTVEANFQPDAPPSYDDTIKTTGAWYPPPQHKGASPPGYPAPPSQGYPAPPSQGYPAPPPTQVVQVPAIELGCQAVRMVCPSCQQSISTQTSSSPSVLAWGMSAILCLTMLWPCFCIPLCVDSLQKVKHKCPSCKIVLGRYNSC